MTGSFRMWLCATVLSESQRNPRSANRSRSFHLDYDHRARSYERYAGQKKYGRKPNPPRPTDAEKADSGFETEPRYWMLREMAEGRIRETIGDRVMVAFRDVARPWRDQRTAKAAIVPRYPATDKLPILAIGGNHAFEFLGIFNSTTFDFLARGHLPGASLKKWIVSQVAAPPPGLDPRIAAHAENLSLTSYSVASLFGREPHRWDPEERYQLDVEVDALVAHAYGITEKQYEIVLDAFEVMPRMQIKKYGFYKLKVDCLAAYRRLG